MLGSSCLFPGNSPGPTLAPPYSLHHFSPEMVPHQVGGVIPTSTGDGPSSSHSRVMSPMGMSPPPQLPCQSGSDIHVSQSVCVFVCVDCVLFACYSVRISCCLGPSATLELLAQLLRNARGPEGLTYQQLQCGHEGKPRQQLIFCRFHSNRNIAQCCIILSLQKDKEVCHIGVVGTL